jgi:hypothetical protein
MRTWHKKSVEDQDTAAEMQRRVQDAFVSISVTEDDASRVAVFFHEEMLTFYFSPEAATIAVLLGALPCEPPARDHIALVVGDESWCWESLFPPPP